MTFSPKVAKVLNFCLSMFTSTKSRYTIYSRNRSSTLYIYIILYFFSDDSMIVDYDF